LDDYLHHPGIGAIRAWLACRPALAGQAPAYRQGEAVGRRWAQGGASAQERALLINARSVLSAWEWELVFTPHPLVSQRVEVWLFLALPPESDDAASLPSAPGGFFLDGAARARDNPGGLGVC
jgi:hypothetical protein